MHATSSRPCKIPAIQIDTWHTSVQDAAPSADAIAREVCVERVPLLVRSLLRGERPHRIQDFAQMVQYARRPLCVAINCGQLYMHADWRVRYGDMDNELQRLVLREPKGIQAAFEQHYDADAVERMLMHAIGPARAEGTRSYLQFHADVQMQEQ